MNLTLYYRVEYTLKSISERKNLATFVSQKFALLCRNCLSRPNGSRNYNSDGKNKLPSYSFVLLAEHVTATFTATFTTTFTTTS